MRDPQAIVVTGASSGIGEALAAIYAAPGVTLALGGRDAARLAGVAARCRAAGARVLTGAVDVRDREGMARWLTGLDQATPVDLVIANAGVSASTSRGQGSEEQARSVFEVNVGGMLNTIHPLIEPMRRRRRGQIALMSSLAAFRALPGAPAYCASKAAVRLYGEALRPRLAREGIAVCVICPGYVRSPMTASNRAPMPFLMDASRAARLIRRGLERDRARIAFPWPLYLAARLVALLPMALTDPLLDRASDWGSV